MPDQNNTDPNSQSTTSTQPQVTDPPTDTGTPPVQVTTPQDIPDFQSTDIPPIPEDVSPPASDIGSSAPPEIPPVASSTPKKKYGGGKIIATILGFLILAGGIIGGVVLTQQQQDIREKASSCRTSADCGSGQSCQSGQCVTTSSGLGGTTKPISSSGLGGTTTTDKSKDTSGVGGTTKPTATATSGLGSNIKTTCTTSLDCGVGQSCVSGECITSGGLGGTTKPISSSGLGGTTKPSGNCAENTGNCFVITHIGISVTDGKVCDGPHYTTCAQGYVCSNQDCVPATSPPGGGGGGPTAQCQDIKAYTPAWTLLTATQLSQLEASDQVNFCVKGATTQGTFDKGKFTINGVAQAETTTQRPSSTDFCQLYTIPASTTTFNITAQIHHPTLGWK